MDCGGKPERFAALAQEVAQSRPDVIHVVSARLAHQLKAASSEIPVVAMTADPVAWGLAASMARPGGNVTGVTSDVGPDLVTKNLELLKELTPTASRVGLLAPKAVLDSVYFRALRDAAQKVGSSSSHCLSKALSTKQSTGGLSVQSQPTKCMGCLLATP